MPSTFFLRLDLHLIFKYLHCYFTNILKKCIIFTDDSDRKIFHDKFVNSIVIKLKYQQCAPN